MSPEPDAEYLAPVTLAILAGGEGSRMGRAKGLLQIEGVSILEWILDRADWRGPTLLVTAPGREQPPGWQRFDQEATDPAAGLGPLRGILTALEAAQTERTVISAVDMPLMAGKQFDWLARQEVTKGILLQHKDQIEPLPMLVHRDARFVLESCLSEGRSALRGLAGENGFSLLEAPGNWDDRVWTNLNFPNDLFLQSIQET